MDKPSTDFQKDGQTDIQIDKQKNRLFQKNSVFTTMQRKKCVRLKTDRKTYLKIERKTVRQKSQFLQVYGQNIRLEDTRIDRWTERQKKWQTEDKDETW